MQHSTPYFYCQNKRMWGWNPVRKRRRVFWTLKEALRSSQRGEMTCMGPLAGGLKSSDSLAFSTTWHPFLFIQTMFMHKPFQQDHMLPLNLIHRAHLVEKSLVLARMESRADPQFMRLRVLLRDWHANPHHPTFLYIFQRVSGWTKECMFRTEMTTFLWVVKTWGLQPKEKWSPGRRGSLNSRCCSEKSLSWVTFLLCSHSVPTWTSCISRRHHDCWRVNKARHSYHRIF